MPLKLLFLVCHSTEVIFQSEERLPVPGRRTAELAQEGTVLTTVVAPPPFRSTATCRTCTIARLRARATARRRSRRAAVCSTATGRTSRRSTGLATSGACAATSRTRPARTAGAAMSRTRAPSSTPAAAAAAAAATLRAPRSRTATSFATARNALIQLYQMHVPIPTSSYIRMPCGIYRQAYAATWWILWLLMQQSKYLKIRCST